MIDPRCSPAADSRQASVTLPPLLKWPGGKRRLLSQILPLLPAPITRYYEPFFGGGALFFALQPSLSFLSDTNPELISCYVQIRDHPHKVVSVLKNLKNDVDTYYRVRDSTPASEPARAARLIYLTTLAFNGIYRQNLSGRFNVPYGHKYHVDPHDAEKIMQASRALQGTSLQPLDFEEAVSTSQAGDTVYFDPPYTVAHGTNGFVKYNAKIFSWDDQKRLADTARALRLQGCSVFVSNADHPSITELYRDFKVVKVSRSSVIAASSGFRKQITECLFIGGSASQ